MNSSAANVDGEEAAGDGAPSASAPREHQTNDSHDSSSNNNRNDNDVIEASKITYCMNAFDGTAKPVALTMLLSALASNYVRSEESAKAREQAITASYSTVDVDDSASSSTKLGLSLINGLVIIGAITLMTFAVVLLYKYRCFAVLKGYLTLSILFLLGYFGSVMFNELIQNYELWISKISFALFMYNFTVVGVYSLFYGKGVPVYVGQGYLIMVSVLLSWELSHFSELLAWVLLVLLALYDLYAVLSPCGPLKALVNLMGQDGAPPLPALLYEARLPASNNGARRQGQSSSADAQRHQQQQSNQSQSTRTASHQNGNGPGTSSSLNTNNVFQEGASSGPSSVSDSNPTLIQEGTNGNSRSNTEDGPSALEHLTPIPPPLPIQTDNGASVAPSSSDVLVQSPTEMVVSSSPEEFETVSRPTGTIPLAIAKLYKIPLVDGTPTEGDFEVNQLRQMVDVYFPCNGGRIERLANPSSDDSSNNNARRWFGRNNNTNNTREQEPDKYNVFDRHGVVKRTIFVGTDGKVYRCLDEQEQEEEERSMPGSIKLGLGDFIFYSVLVSKASLYSFPTFMACVVGILTGLLLTLVLLAIRGKALPALPISIFFGVAFYLPTRFFLLPYAKEMHRDQLYF